MGMNKSYGSKLCSHRSIFVLVHASGSSPSIFAVLRLIMFRARIDFSVESFVITALLARSEGGPRLENAVTSDAKIIDSGPKGTQAAKRHRTCQTRHIHTASGPATNLGPSLGMKTNAEPKNNPTIPPPNAPILPQNFMRFAAL